MFEQIDDLRNSFYGKNKAHLYVLGVACVSFVLIIGLYHRRNIYVVKSNSNHSDANNNECIETTSLDDTPYSVGGAVKNPGVYYLRPKALVSDLLVAAGGLTSDANDYWVAKDLNLSQMLEGNSHTYIPYTFEFVAEQTVQFKIDDQLEVSSITNQVSATNQSEQNPNQNTISNQEIYQESLVNVNSAQQQILEELPGIGPVYAQKIILNRTYKDFNEFLSNSNVPEAVAKKIEPLISF